MWKYSLAKFANFVYFCITREKALPHFHIVVTLLLSKFDNCMKFRMPFLAALNDFPNSKVCLIGEWSIPR